MRSLPVLWLLVGVVLVGCGASASARSSPDPAALAAELEHAQTVVDDASASAASLEAAARSQQLAVRQLADHRGLRAATLARLSPRSRASAKAALRAANALATIVPRERRFPHWRIVSPPAAGTLLGYFKRAAARYVLAWQYLAAIELVETRMGRIHGLSPAGAQGPMQFMPSTWAEYGHGSIDSQPGSIMAAARFLAVNGAPGNMGRALLHYNPSHAYVVAVEAYAREMQRDARAFYGFYWWQVLYKTAKGTFLLPLGYPHVRPQLLPGP